MSTFNCSKLSREECKKSNVNWYIQDNTTACIYNLESNGPICEYNEDKKICQTREIENETNRVALAEVRGGYSSYFKIRQYRNNYENRDTTACRERNQTDCGKSVVYRGGTAWGLHDPREKCGFQLEANTCQWDKVERTCKAKEQSSLTLKLKRNSGDIKLDVDTNDLRMRTNKNFVLGMGGAVALPESRLNYKTWRSPYTYIPVPEDEAIKQELKNNNGKLSKETRDEILKPWLQDPKVSAQELHRPLTTEESLKSQEAFDANPNMGRALE